MRYSQCVVCNETVGWIGLMANLALSTLKLFVGVISGSHALVADSLYSAKDVITSLIIIVGLKISKQPIDQEHPFGHGKIEFILALVVSLVLLILTGILFFFSAETLLEGVHTAPHLIALWTALLSVAVNLFMYKYTKCVSVEINSPVVGILSTHHFADSLSSVAVALGIIGSHYLGMPWLDTVVALGEALHLIYLGSEVFWNAFKGLMDTSAPKETVIKIKKVAAECSGVESVEQVRTRLVGQELWIDMTVSVNPELSVGSAKVISRRVEEQLATNIPHVGDIGVHFHALPGSVPEMVELKQEILQLSGSEEEEEPDKGLV
ncbi:MAG: magnetosome biogenesis CDF transporter MamM [Magnetococcales bacterium]|nr:magnetosome biogenesis CDF transporter MamM [Magnetococcales bacterium]